MAADISSGSSYIWLSNLRLRGLIESAIEVARELALTEEEKGSVSRFEHWCKENLWPGNGINLDEHFHSCVEYKLWAQAFESLGWRVFHRKQGDQDDEIWQVGFIATCHVVSHMLVEHVWKEDRNW